MKTPVHAFWVGLFLLAVRVCAQPAPTPVEVGQPLPAWSEGGLDIHSINTGRGESSFLILPDGTTLLVDASGSLALAPPFTLPSKPDAFRAPGEWIARYITRALRGFLEPRIDYAVISHFHDDHMGGVKPGTKRSSHGDYQLSGITEIAEHIPIAKLIDRNWPDYNWPAPLDNLMMKNYRKFLQWQSANRHLEVERFQAGRNDQLVLRHQPARYPTFEIRNLAVNGVVWTGVAANTRNHFPPLETLAREDYPIENNCSIAFRVSYGSFDYFSGGDLSSRGLESAAPAEAWKDIERPVAMVAGPVEVLKAGHHGSWDANSAAFLGLLHPRVIVVNSRALGHPAVNTFQRMLSTSTWPGPRDIFVTNTAPETEGTTYNLERAKSREGHVVIRVQPGGASYRVFILDDSDEEQRVKAVFGPYISG